jgi:hypothetical protein
MSPMSPNVTCEEKPWASTALGTAQRAAYFPSPFDALTDLFTSHCFGYGSLREPSIVDSRIDRPAIEMSLAAMRANRP